jgi:hypothetical protein
MREEPFVNKRFLPHPPPKNFLCISSQALPGKKCQGYTARCRAGSGCRTYGTDESRVRDASVAPEPIAKMFVVIDG